MPARLIVLNYVRRLHPDHASAQ